MPAKTVQVDFKHDVGDFLCHVADKEQDQLFVVTQLEMNICHGQCQQRFYICRQVSRDGGWYGKGKQVKGVGVNFVKLVETEVVAYDPEKEAADEEAEIQKSLERMQQRGREAREAAKE